jgi:4-amino-4-deoxy-L-arabinose transferase-like glycosyltransferase
MRARLTTDPAVAESVGADAAAADRTAPVAAGIRKGPPALRLLRGAQTDPGWVRPALLALLLLTAAFYLFGLTRNGYANSYYAAAVKAGTLSVKAWLFGSLDSANSITVDKPPASLWVMVLSCRLLGFSSFALLLPQVLAGVGTVGLTYAGVRRWAGPAAGVAAGVLVALTPVAALMFRFDNPDALLVLLVTAAAYAVVRAIDAPDRGAIWWMVLAGALVGVAFLTKMGQGLFVLPGMVLVYAVAAPIPWWRRTLHLLTAGASLMVSAGWYLALVAWWPAGSRPYIGGSSDNSLWQLAVVYNGLGRLFGGDANIPATYGSASDQAGPGRMFGPAFGPEIAWLLPAALVAIGAGIWFNRKAPRTDRTRAAMMMWGGWLICTGLVLSYMKGISHSYYSLIMVPPAAATIAVVGTRLWRARGQGGPRWVLAVMIAGTGLWGSFLLDRTVPGWLPLLRWSASAGSVGGALWFALAAPTSRRPAGAALSIGVLAASLAMGAFTVATVATPSSGVSPKAGPASQFRAGPGSNGANPPTGTLPPDGPETSAALVGLVDSSHTTWAAAINGSSRAASLELVLHAKAVMAIGGYTWTDPSPTLDQFRADVAAGRIGYYIAVPSTAADRAAGTALAEGRISAWVASHFVAATVGGWTVYPLRARS